MQFQIPEAEVGTFVKQASLVQKQVLADEEGLSWVCDVVLAIQDREGIKEGHKPQANYIFTGSGKTPDEAIKKMFDQALSEYFVVESK